MDNVIDINPQVVFERERDRDREDVLPRALHEYMLLGPFDTGRYQPVGADRPPILGAREQTSPAGW